MHELHELSWSKKMKRFFLLSFAALIGLTYSGCETKPTTQQKLDEAGREMNAAGQHLNDAANKTADAMGDLAHEAADATKKAVNEGAEAVKHATDGKDTTVTP